MTPLKHAADDTVAAIRALEEAWSTTSPHIRPRSLHLGIHEAHAPKPTEPRILGAFSTRFDRPLPQTPSAHHALAKQHSLDVLLPLITIFEDRMLALANRMVTDVPGFSRMDGGMPSFFATLESPPDSKPEQRVKMWLRPSPYAAERAHYHSDASFGTAALPGIVAVAQSARSVRAPGSGHWVGYWNTDAAHAVRAQATTGEDALRWMVATQNHALCAGSGAFQLLREEPEVQPMMRRIMDKMRNPHL